MDKLGKYFPVFLIAYELAVNMSNDMYLPAVANMMSYFNTTSFYIQLTLSSWFAGTMIINLVLGTLSDHVGRKKVLLYSGILFLTATLYCSYPNNIYLFFLARFIQGVSVTSIVVCGYALIHDHYENKQAIIIISWMLGALIIAPMLGPLLGGFIMKLLSWHAIFIVLAIFASLSLVGIYFSMPEFVHQPLEENFSIRQEINAFSRIVTDVNFMLGSLTYSFLFAALIAWITASPFLIIETLKFSPLTFGFLQIPVFGSFILGILLLKLFLYLDINEEKIIRGGMVCIFIVGIITLVYSSIYDVYLTELIGFTSLFSFLFGIISSPLNRITVTSLNDGMGKVMAVFDLVMGITATIITVIINVKANNMCNYMLNFIFSLVIISTFFYSFKLRFFKRCVHESPNI